MKKKRRILSYIGIAAIAAIPTVSFALNEALERQMLSHVEKIIVVDSIEIDKDNFFKLYKLHPSAGRLLDPNEIQDIGVTTIDAEEPEIGFTNEFNDYMLWSQPDTTGYLRLAESLRLMDGSWSEPVFLPEVLSFMEVDDEGVVDTAANASYPFMLDDGVTLYYAADGQESVGGYDIFVAMRDPSDGSFLKPRNVGMPYNSEYDDYMMAIDQQTGVGWWVTDRNQIEDKLTLYIYVLPEARENVDPDDENLLSYATLYGWEELINEEDIPKIQQIKREIVSIKPAHTKAEDFHLVLPTGEIYTTFDDFKTPAAAQKMRRYLEDEMDVEDLRYELEELREEFYKSGKDKRMSQKILTAENNLRKEERKLKASLSNIIKLETTQNRKR